MQKIERKSAGVKFESDVLAFADALARQQQRSRSFIVNTGLRWYARHIAEQHRIDAAQEVPTVIKM